MQWAGESKRIAFELPPPKQWEKVKGLVGRGNAYVAGMQMRNGGEKRFPRMVEGGLVSPR